MYGNATKLEKQIDAKLAWLLEKYYYRSQESVGCSSSQADLYLTEKELHLDEEAGMKRIFKKRSKKKAKNKQVQARDGKGQVKSKSKLVLLCRDKNKCACCVRRVSSKSQPLISFELLWSQSQPSKCFGNGEGLPTWLLYNWDGLGSRVDEMILARERSGFAGEKVWGDIPVNTLFASGVHWKSLFFTHLLMVLKKGSFDSLHADYMANERSFFCTKCAFFRIELHVYPSQVVECFFDVSEYFTLCVALYYQVVYVHFQVPANLFFECLIYESLRTLELCHSLVIALLCWIQKESFKLLLQIYFCIFLIRHFTTKSRLMASTSLLICHLMETSQDIDLLVMDIGPFPFCYDLPDLDRVCWVGVCDDGGVVGGGRISSCDDDADMFSLGVCEFDLIVLLIQRFITALIPLCESLMQILDLDCLIKVDSTRTLSKYN
ncbi:hypothetical protein Tco_0816037 [Tanacetum coccineum]